MFAAVFVVPAAYAGQIANVDYVHKYIAQKRGVTVPINAPNIYQAANVKYLLCTVDSANHIFNNILNSSTTREFCNDPLATTQAIDTAAVDIAVNNLVRACIFNTPALSTAAAIACIGRSDTCGYWQMIDSYTATTGNLVYKRVGSVPPGLYRIETNYPGGGFASNIILTNATMYYGFSDIYTGQRTGLSLSIKNPFTVGAPLPTDGSLCDWYFLVWPNCYNPSYPGIGISLDQNDGIMDYVMGPITPGITALNTTTPPGAAAIYAWTNTPTACPG